MTTEETAPEANLPPAYRVVWLESVQSTMDEARQRAEAGADNFTLIWAGEQLGGRGRQGRNWASPKGNLYLSIILRPACTPAVAAQLSFLSAVALSEAFGKVAPPMAEVTFKWPNDVLLNGRKAAGILLESKSGADEEVDYLLIGMGVNIQSHPEDTPFPATSLRFEGCSPDITEAAVLEAFSRPFLAWVHRWLDEGFPPVRKAWLNHAAHIGEEIEVRLKDETLKGVFDALDEEGHLLLKLAGGEIRRISAGDVYF